MGVYLALWLLMPWCLKHQAICIHNAGKMLILLDQYYAKIPDL